MGYTIFQDGRRIEEGNDTTRTVTTYDDTGAVTSARPYTDDENAVADDEAAQLAAVAQAEAARAAIINRALTWLADDADQASARITQIEAALADIDAQIAQVGNYTMNATTVPQIVNVMNKGLLPMLSDILTRQRQIATQLAELNTARDRHGDALVWLGRYVARD